MLDDQELYDMLSKWSGINIDPKNQEYCMFEQLEINHPNDWYIIDHIPKIIYNADKHSQLENQYPPIKKSYKKIVDRYLRFMNLIWAMDTLRAYINMKELYMLKLKNIFKTYRAIQYKHYMPLQEISNIKDIKKIVELALQDKLSIIIYCQELELMIVISLFVISIFTKNEQSKQMIQKMATTEGLYVRKYIVTPVDELQK